VGKLGIMIELKPVKSEKVWGYENWIASTHKDGPQPEFVALAGDYPLLVKVIQANDTLSVQVHPDDVKAVELEGKGSRGKTECWYVLSAEPDAKLVYGLNKNYTKDELAKAIKDCTLESCLNSVNVKKGDFIFIPSGTVHAIGGGLRLLEVQQSCNITYRLYDWGRPREVHIDKGIASIKNEQAKEIKPLEEEFECQYFSLHNFKVKGGYSFFVHKNSLPELVFVVSGSGTIRSLATDGTKNAEFAIAPESIFAVEAGEKVTVEGNAEIIRICAK